MLLLVATLVAINAAQTPDDQPQDRDASSFEALCRGPMQSPIDIQPSQAIKQQNEARIVYRPWRIEDVASVDHEGRIPRIKFKSENSPGILQIGNNLAESYDEYALTSLQVHAPSEHTFRRATWPVEIQLWHEPLPLPRIKDLASKISDLERQAEIVDERLSVMDSLAERLSLETDGTASPWQLSPEKTRTDEKLDWLDTNKQRVVAEATELEEETREHFNQAKKLSQQAKNLVTMQRRHFAAHRVAVSIFMVRSPPPFMHTQNGSSTDIINWLAAAMANASKDGSTSPLAADRKDEGGPILDVSRTIASAGTKQGQDWNFFAYEGSLVRPPCTPDVRWLVAAEPLAASLRDLERLLAVTQLARTDTPGRTQWVPVFTVLDDERDIPKIRGRRELQKLRLQAHPFPKLWEQQDEADPALEKWVFVQRYCKVFFLSATCVIITPILFAFLRMARASQDDEDDDVVLRKGSEALIHGLLRSHAKTYSGAPSPPAPDRSPREGKAEASETDDPFQMKRPTARSLGSAAPLAFLRSRESSRSVSPQPNQGGASGSTDPPRRINATGFAKALRRSEIRKTSTESDRTAYKSRQAGSGRLEDRRSSRMPRMVSSETEPFRIGEGRTAAAKAGTPSLAGAGVLARQSSYERTTASSRLAGTNSKPMQAAAALSGGAQEDLRPNASTAEDKASTSSTSIVAAEQHTARVAAEAAEKGDATQTKPLSEAAGAESGEGSRSAGKELAAAEPEHRHAASDEAAKAPRVEIELAPRGASCDTATAEAAPLLGDEAAVSPREPPVRETSPPCDTGSPATKGQPEDVTEKDADTGPLE
eukprot:TRINITY_DN27428_c0_g1_i2.p1 TRINITY_DN27428_c0_g1~~TRINITY_DN27428_c0_g1_i2.p1  ORF type:complete len:824 (-),score=185.28 TRINITY_DN27428_c0_g1_i2:119-2590(-)